MGGGDLYALDFDVIPCGESSLSVLCCDRGFHLFCLRPISARVPTGAWFCPSCSGNEPSERFPLQQTKIVDFFRIQICDAEQAGKCKQAGKCRMFQVDFAAEKVGKKLVGQNMLMRKLNAAELNWHHASTNTIVRDMPNNQGCIDSTILSQLTGKFQYNILA